jgi:hypothetical protein
VGELGPVAQERLQRVLVFLSVSGGAALLCKRRSRVIASAGKVEVEVASALSVPLDSQDEVRFVRPDTLIADVGLHHRLIVRVPRAALGAGFKERVHRARVMVERFGLYPKASASGAPPTSAPAHAFLDSARRPRRP